MDVLLTFYLGGAGFLAIRLATRLIALLRVLRRHPVVTVNGHRVVDVDSGAVACSFFQTILLNRKRLGLGDIERVLQHERVHIRQCHTLDILLAEAVTVVLWFNPFAWLYSSALRITHECLADAAVLQTGVHPRTYATLVLSQLMGTRQVSLASTMSLRFVEQRIDMMSKTPSPRRAGLKVLAGVPVLASLLVAFAIHLVPAPRIVSAARGYVGVPAADPGGDPLAPVLIEDAERVFDDILSEMAQRDYMCRSYIYMRLACMRIAGWEDIDYATLMLVSGYGLTFAYEAKEQSGAHFRKPAGTDERIARATGFGWEWLRFDDIEQCWRALKQSIDSGRPVHAPHMEEVLFVGYQEAERKRDRKVRPLAIPVFVDRGTWWSWRQFENWFQEYGGHLGRFAGRKEMLPARNVAIDVMKMLVTLAHDDPRSQDPDFDRVQWGLAGIEAFAVDMADLSKTERDFCSGWFGCHDSNPQTTARRLTGQYLMDAADLFDDPVAALMREAARDCQSAHQAWLTWDRHLGRYGPNHGWRSREHRLAGAQAAREALEHERRAVETIRKALSYLSS